MGLCALFSQIWEETFQRVTNEQEIYEGKWNYFFPFTSWIYLIVYSNVVFAFSSQHSSMIFFS